MVVMKYPKVNSRLQIDGQFGWLNVPDNAPPCGTICRAIRQRLKITVSEGIGMKSFDIHTFLHLNVPDHGRSLCQEIDQRRNVQI